MGPTDIPLNPDLSWRSEPRSGDVELVSGLCRDSGMFSPAEVEVAAELVQARRLTGEASGYHFLFAEWEGLVLGYACYGPIACTMASWDLYWIVVSPGLQGRGLGRRLLERVEQNILAAGGRRLYVETSSRGKYHPTRGFYQARGYQLAARLDDYYATGDGMVIYLKVLAGEPPQARLDPRAQPGKTLDKAAGQVVL